MAAAPPVPLAPALAAKPAAPALASASSPSPGTPGSVTSKEWVIPPRPKPGRKPATDTPPTKRKAQNRAAQRAFRERRAARVNELEDQMKAIDDEHDAEIAAFKREIGSLSHEVEQCRNETNWWRDRCRALEKEVSAERNAKEALVQELRSARPKKDSSIPDQVPLPPRRSARNAPSAAQVDTRRETNGNEGGDAPMGCSNCSSAHCQCVEDAFVMPGIEEQEKSHSRRPGFQDSGSRQKEHAGPEIKPEPEEMEVDFTSRFAGIQPQAEASNTVSSSPAVDPCGFCQDGTPCICAEMAAQEEHRPRRNSFENNRLAPIQNLSQFTPPPSEGDVRSEVTLPSISEATNPCANGPGTCAQCQADPRSTLFCKSLAASRSASGTPSGCCGGKGADGGCCQSQPQSQRPPRSSRTPRRAAAAANPAPKPPPQSADSLTLSCADTFTTLSRHPNFSRASDEISSWVPKLHTLPNPRDLPPVEQPEARGPMEVEAASVMGVLRYFDRRFADK